MIPLMKNAFLNELETKRALADFIMTAPRLSMDLQCLEFEKKFSEYQGRQHSVLFNSGASANLAILQALKNLNLLNDQDRIGFSAITWSTNVMPIIQMGLQPVAVDCSFRTLNVMLENLRATHERFPLKAFFATNVLGLLGELQEIKKYCQENNILFLEDNCEALGSEIDGVKSGNFSLASSFSFFVAHHMSTIEGGMVTTDDHEFATMLKIVRANGWDRNLSSTDQLKLRKQNNIKSEFDAKYTFYDLGFNLRPTEITGFLGIQQLQYLEENIRIREKNFLYFEEIIRNNNDLITLEHSHISRLSSFAIPIVCKSKELRAKYLSQFTGGGVEVRPMIAGNIQVQPFYKKYVKTIVDLPGTEFLHENSFYCGNYPELSKIEIEVISSCLSSY